MKTCHAILAGMMLASSASHAGWTEQVVNNPSGILFVVDAVDENVVWTAGDNQQVFRTTDGGSNWELRPTPSGRHRATCSADRWPR